MTTTQAHTLQLSEIKANIKHSLDLLQRAIDQRNNFDMDSSLLSDELLVRDDTPFIEAFKWITVGCVLDCGLAERLSSFRDLLDQETMIYPTHKVAYEVTRSYLLDLGCDPAQFNDYFPDISWMYELWDWNHNRSDRLFSITKKSLLAQRHINRPKNGIHEIPEAIANLSNLEQIDLHYNSLKHLPSELGKCQKLTSIDVGFNYIETLPDSIVKLSELTDLSISYNRLTTLPDDIGLLANLKRLVALGNPITCLPESICLLSNLELLDLRETLVAELPAGISQLTQLKKLFLSSKYISANEQTRIKQLLPHCDIRYDVPWMTDYNLWHRLHETALAWDCDEEEKKTWLRELAGKKHDFEQDIELFAKKLATYPKFF